MFGIDAVEFVLLTVLAVILFGPERLPAFARKAARVFVYLRDIANNAQTQLREELGPEFSDLSLKDLNPKEYVRKHMSEEIQAIEEAKRDLAGVKTTVEEAATLAKVEAADADRTLKAGAAGATAAAIAHAANQITPFDDEAT